MILFTSEGSMYLIELIINEDNNLSKEQLLFLKNILKKHDVYYSKIIRGTFLNDKSIDIAINGKDINWEENFDMTIITIVCESIALYLNGNLEKIENINKGEVEK